MNPLLLKVIKWVGERALHVIIYGAIILTIGFSLYSAFLKPTTTQNTKVESGGTVNYYWKDAKVSSLFGCQNLRASELMKTLKEKK